MKKWTIILMIFALLLNVAAADEAMISKAQTISLRANETTGYQWNGFVLGGDSVTLNDSAGIYVMDSNPEMLDGVGGQTYFTLTPVKPGCSIVIFSYARGWEPEPIDQRVLLADVDEMLNLFLTDVTESGVYDGEVISVDEEEHTVLLKTEQLGEVIARFDEAETLPVQNERIIIYTNGTMTMSLPAIVNVIAWQTAPDERGR